MNEDVKTIEDALHEMAHQDTPESRKWDMLAITLQWIAEQLGVETDKNMDS